jgi:hypothetical protein
MKINEYRTEFRASPCTHPYTPDIQEVFLQSIHDRKEKCQALHMAWQYSTGGPRYQWLIGTGKMLHEATHLTG